MKAFYSLLLAACLLLSGCTAPAPPAEVSPPPQSLPDDGVQLPVDTPFALAVHPNHSLHPVLTSNRTNLILAPLLYEPLFLVDEQFRAQKVLCQDYSVSEDGLVWTFSLHSGVTFSDGTPLTGRLAARALELACTGDSRYAVRLDCIRDIKGDEDTLTITLHQPRSTLPLLLDIPIALGEEARPLGTGPYVLSGTEEEPLLTARSDWWQQAPLPADILPLYPVDTEDELIFAFDAGNVSLVGVDFMGTNAPGYSASCEVWDYATTDLIYLAFNTREDRLFEDADLRRALALAVDRATIVKTIFAGHAAASPLPVHPDSLLWDDQLAARWNYDTAPLVEAVSDLKQSRRVLTLLVNSENAAKVSTAELIAYQLESVGLAVTLNILPFEDYTAALKAGNFDLYLGEVVLTADFDLSPLLAPDGPLNYGGWTDEAVLPLLDALCRAAQEDTAPFRALLAHLEQQAPIAPICFRNNSVLTQWGRLSGLSPLRENVFYRLENWIME